MFFNFQILNSRRRCLMLTQFNWMKPHPHYLHLSWKSLDPVEFYRLCYLLNIVIQVNFIGRTHLYFHLTSCIVEGLYFLKDFFISWQTGHYDLRRRVRSYVSCLPPIFSETVSSDCITLCNTFCQKPHIKFFEILYEFRWKVKNRSGVFLSKISNWLFLAKICQ